MCNMFSLYLSCEEKKELRFLDDGANKLILYLKRNLFPVWWLYWRRIQHQCGFKGVLFTRSYTLYLCHKGAVFNSLIGFRVKWMCTSISCWWSHLMCPCCCVLCCWWEKKPSTVWLCGGNESWYRKPFS